jgi:hypothetical protein
MAKNPALELYLWMLDNVHMIKSGRAGQHLLTKGEEDNPTSMGVDYQVLWARLREARLFNIPTVLMEDTYDEVAAYVGSLVRLGEQDEMSPEEGTDLLIKTGCDHPFPEQLAFDHMLFLYPWNGRKADGSPSDPKLEEIASVVSAGIVLDDEQLAWRYGPHTVPALREHGVWSVLGHLVSHDGQAWELLRWTQLHLAGLPDSLLSLEDLSRLPRDADIGISTGFAVTRLRDEVKWWSPLSMTPWALSAVINMINDYKTLVIDKPKTSDRMATRRWAKKRGLKNIRPPMFYGIMLHDNIVFTDAIREQFTSDGRQSYLNFRSDVRGHERCRIRRGPMPMSDAERQKFLSRGYTLYEHLQDLDSEDEKRLRERGMALKERGEWLAIKTTWVDSYMKGPEDAPYRPAIRHLPVQPPTSWE